MIKCGENKTKKEITRKNEIPNFLSWHSFYMTTKIGVKIATSAKNKNTSRNPDNQDFFRSVILSASKLELKPKKERRFF